MSSGLWPSREPAREYGLGVGAPFEGRPGVRADVDALRLGLLGVVADRTPLTLLDKGLRAGVGWRLGVCLLSGDSGRGSEGLLGLSCGL